MKTGVFLQARVGSLRLPGKVLKQIEKESVLTWCMRALSAIDVDVRAVLVDYPSAAKLKSIVLNDGFLLCVGSTEDVLSRFARFASFFSLDWIIRATADNPCVSACYAARLLTDAQEHAVDYARYTNLPRGVGVECIRGQALAAAHEATNDAYEREHVCPHLYANPKRYNLLIKPVVFSAPIDETKMNFSVSIDTPEDLESLRLLFSKRKKSQKGRSIELEELIQLQ